ncbi:MAG: glucokinase [Acidobacteria bacterium]|nr:glucokinase [Acidobacteriota bacterium]
MLLAGDVGGTKTLLGLFEPAGERPRPVAVRAYETAAFNSFTEILDAFARDVQRPLTIDAFVSGVAGPVVGDAAHLTNITWNVSTAEMAAGAGTTRVRLLNDLEAMANSAEVLTPGEVVPLQHGVTREDGNAVVIAAGTGLGEAYVPRVGGRLRPVPSEGGHADFAPRTDREIELLRMLRAEYGRVEVEHVVSGPGLVNLHRFTHGRRECSALRGVTAALEPAAISQAALAAHCPACVEALSIFVSAYGAEAGNLALRGVATSGVYVGGGMAPKILPALQDGRFMEAFRAKGVMSDLVAQMPVKVILNPEAGLLGAAVYAQEMIRT